LNLKKGIACIILMRNYFLLLASFFIFTIANSQSRNHNVSGAIIERSTGDPLEFATVTFFTSGTENIVTGGITDLDGKFTIRVPEGTYDIRFEYISYKTITLNGRTIDSNTQLDPIVLEIDSESLDEVVVRAETTQVQVRLDKKIYNVGKDLTVAGGTVGDALNNVPSVSADVDGTISLRGNENVRVLINGKPSSLAGFGDSDVLQQLPAEAIESIEVISSPSARYDAEGTAGIINIILKRERILGFNGSVQASVGIPDNHSLVTNLNYRTQKFNIFNTTTLNLRRPPGNAFFDNTYTSGAFDRITEDRIYERDNRDIGINLGMQYFITDYESILASVYVRPASRDDDNVNETNRFINGNFDSRTIREEFERRDDNRSQASLNYEKIFDPNNRDHKLTVDGQLSWRDGNQEVNISENEFSGSDPNGTLLAQDLIFEDQKSFGYLLQADYVLPIGENGQFEAGFRGDYNDNETGFELNTLNSEGELALDELSNTFNYNENVTAAYVQYGNKIGSNLSFLLGLRYEYTQLKGLTSPFFEGSDALEQYFPDGEIELDFDNRLSNFFPTVNIIYELQENENITFGYNRRINRPRSWYINPFPSRSSRTTIFQGNPSLTPAFADAFDIGYLKRWEKFTLTSSIYYQRETNSFERIQEDIGLVTEDGINIIINRPINLSTNERIGAEAGMLYNPSRKLRFNGSFNFFQFNSQGEYRGRDFGAKNVSWFARLSSNVVLPWDFNWQTNAFYRGPTENAQTKHEGIFAMDMAMSKEIIKDKATITLNVRDLFNSRKRISETDTELFTSYSEFQWRERQITLTFIYRFNPQNGNDRSRRGRNGGGGGEDFDDFPG